MSVRIVVDGRKAGVGTIGELAAACESHPGFEAVTVEILTDDGPRALRLRAYVEPSEELYAKVRELGWVAIPE